MIYCPQCGNPNFDDANFCDTCGEPLINADEYARMRNKAEMEQLLEMQRQQREAQAYNKVYRKAQKEAKKAAKAKGGKGSGSPGAGGNAGNANGGAGSRASGSGAAAGAADGAAAGGAPADFTMYKHGCLAQAWDDITETKGWGPKIVALGLLNVVPILNFFVNGYAMRWARQLPEDKVEPMPEKIFADGNFLQGFYAFVIMVVVGLVCGVTSGLLGLIPIVGVFLATISGIAVGLFTTMFQSLSLMRVAIARKLGPGFNVGKIWKVITGRQFGKLFCATVLPGLIISCAILFVCGSVLIIFGLNSLTALFDEVQNAQQLEIQIQEQIERQQQIQDMMRQDPFYGWGFFDDMDIFSQFGMNPLDVDPWANVPGMVLGLVPLFFVLYLIAEFMTALNSVLTLRATSHFVTRYCPDWCNFPKTE